MPGIKNNEKLRDRFKLHSSKSVRPWGKSARIENSSKSSLNILTAHSSPRGAIISRPICEGCSLRSRGSLYRRGERRKVARVSIKLEGVFKRTWATPPSSLPSLSLPSPSSLSPYTFLGRPSSSATEETLPPASATLTGFPAPVPDWEASKLSAAPNASGAAPAERGTGLLASTASIHASRRAFVATGAWKGKRKGRLKLSRGGKICWLRFVI